MICAGKAKSLQNKMMNDQGIMGMIQSLQNDPEFRKILEDRDVLKAADAGDIPALMTNPKFTSLLTTPPCRRSKRRSNNTFENRCRHAISHSVCAFID